MTSAETNKQKVSEMEFVFNTDIFFLQTNMHNELQDESDQKWSMSQKQSLRKDTDHMPESFKILVLKDTDTGGKPSPHSVETREMFDRILNAQFGRLNFSQIL